MATRSPRCKPRARSARATPFAMAPSWAKLNWRGLASPPRSMIASFAGSRSRTIRSPRFLKPVMTRHDSSWAFRQRREIGAAAAGNELAVLVEDFRLGGGELRAVADDLAARGEIARHRRPVIIDAQ